MKTKYLPVLGAMIAIAAPCSAATLVSLSSFGGGDSWRAPREVIAGDTAGTAVGGVYSYLGDALTVGPTATGSLERGMAYNPATGNLILVSRGAANGIRILSGTTGADIGAIAQPTALSGGAFAINQVGVTNDGSIFVANLSTNAATSGSNFKIYQWASEAAASSSSATTRLGDTFDVIGSSASAVLVAGAGTGALGYATFTSGVATRIETFTPAVTTGDFRIGLTFAGNSSAVWGKQAGTTLRETTTAGSAASAALTVAGEANMDYALIAGIPYLATFDSNSSLVRIYDVSLPLTPSLLISAATTSGLVTTTGGANVNGNASGSIKWGAIAGDTATLYAMSTNQGIQAFTFQVPEPSAAMLGLAGLGILMRRRRK